MIRKIIRDVYHAITDHNRELSERVFLIFALISELAVFVAFIIDVATGEHVGELLVIFGTLLFVPAVTLVCMYKDRIRIAIGIIVSALVACVLPGLFFFGGGVEGGGVLWVIFAFVYLGLVLSGLWRTILLVFVTIVTAACYLVDYLHPELVTQHSRAMFYLDSFVSLILVGLVCFFMTFVQSRLLTDENARAKKETERAEELTRSQNRFFSSMSHEIRTPINSILGLNELILRNSDATEDIVRDATGIQGAGKMLLALINDILDFSKIEAGSMDIVPVDYRIGDLLSDIVNMIWLRAHDKGLELRVSVDPNVPSVLYGDEVRIKQVIINLLNNAVKYTAEGSVELRVESSEVDERTTELTVSVTDTGMGIRKETLPYLFNVFKRMDEEKNRNIEGTGLGLSIVKQIVELMGGTVAVNSVYGEGSTFTVVLRQEVSDHAPIGELNIHNELTVKRSAYESGFRAPEAVILIVDDNELNLEVEKKLLAETGMTIDTVTNGREALGLTLKKHYDTILMDHLMPEMDGIECLEHIRNQSGGLNRSTPVVVLTANAGSDNRDLYHRAGFDGYLVKPVSGEALENTLVRHIPTEKLVLNSRIMQMREDINASAGYSSKVPVIISSNSVCDLPASIIRKLKIPIIPAIIRTERGVFKDGSQLNADELIRYMEAGGSVTSAALDEAAYTDFFAGALRRCHNLIHISIISSMSDDYRRASEAAKAFDNVTVINSGCLSSATGLLVLIAHRLAQQNLSVEEIVAELMRVKERLMCSFIVDTTEYMSRKGFISQPMHRVARNLNLHPALGFKKDRFGISGIWMGRTLRAYRHYIHKAFPVDIIPDPDVVFITYVDIPMDTLLWIKEEIGRIAYFEHVIFQQASAAISSNCGSGTFGIMYFARSNKSYNLGTYLDDEEEDESPAEPEESGAGDGESSEEDREAGRGDGASRTAGSGSGSAADGGQPPEAASEEKPWYACIEGIDGAAALQNSGSEESLKMIMQLFYDAMEEKTAELNSLYEAEDYDGYTIKIHALKSSARLIGAVDLADRAQLLENAGKEGDIAYIRREFEPFMRDYGKYKGILAEWFSKGENGGSETDETAGTGSDGGPEPEIDRAKLDELYEALREAAGNADADAVEVVLMDLSGCAMTEEERELLTKLRKYAASYDYEKIMGLLE